MADEAAFQELTGLISREVGVSLDAYKSKCLRRRIAGTGRVLRGQYDRTHEDN